MLVRSPPYLTSVLLLLGPFLLAYVQVGCGDSTGGESLVEHGDAGAVDSEGEVVVDGFCEGCESEEPTCAADELEDGDECTQDECVDGAVVHTELVGRAEWQQCTTDITFFAMGDPQYGGGADDKNGFQITAMNTFPGTPWPTALPGGGEPVAEPLGVLVAGDLTQNGRDDRFLETMPDQIGRFHEEYGLTGADGLLHYPVYEGYGNHDFDPDEPDDEEFSDWRWWYTDDPTPSVDSVSERNPDRIGLTRTATGTDGHYSWDWGNVHLINLNLFGGDEPSDIDETSMVRDPRSSLSFLMTDLEEEVGTSERPIIIMMHFGFDAFSREERWWTDEQRESFREAIDGYNIIGIIHGHVHASFYYTWEGYDVFNVGSPYYLDYNDDGRGHFTAFHITDSFMAVGDVGWDPDEAGGNPQFVDWEHFVYFDTCVSREASRCE